MSAHAIHWLSQTFADVPASDDWLAASEALTLAGLRVGKRRAEWRLGRWTAKCAVAAYLGAPWPPSPRVEIRVRASGAPEVQVDQEPAPVEISLSHAADRALCAIAPPGVALGCDVERIAPRSAAFVADYFTAEERQLIAAAPNVGCDELVTLLWSAKESVLKALQEGLRFDTRSVAVVLLPQPPVEGWRAFVAQHADSGRRFEGWWCRDQKRDQKYVLTVAAEPRSCVPVALSGAWNLP